MTLLCWKHFQSSTGTLRHLWGVLDCLVYFPSNTHLSSLSTSMVLFLKTFQVMKYSTTTRKLHFSLDLLRSWKNAVCHCLKLRSSSKIKCTLCLGWPHSLLCTCGESVNVCTFGESVHVCTCGESVQLRTCSCSWKCKWPTSPNLAILVQVKAQFWSSWPKQKRS